MLEFNWETGHPLGAGAAGGRGTRLTLWHNINRGFIAMAAGWHICLMLGRFLSGQPIGRIVGAEVMKFGGWQRLERRVRWQFGVQTPG